MRYEFIQKEKKAFPITLLCSTMNVSRSGYYAKTIRGESKHTQENKKMATVVTAVHKTSRASYGAARRHSQELTAQGLVCGRYRAKTIMAIADVETKQKRRYKATTDRNHKEPVFPDLLKREFTTPTSNVVWVSDITYIRTWSGWLYLAVVIDLFNREAVGWSLGDKIDRHLVINAARMAVWKQKPAPELIFHSNRGSQYCSKDFRDYISDHGIKGSMSCKGNCWDNAVAESFFGSQKKEIVYSVVTRLNVKSNQILLIIARCFTTAIAGTPI